MIRINKFRKAPYPIVIKILKFDFVRVLRRWLTDNVKYRGGKIGICDVTGHSKSFSDRDLNFELRQCRHVHAVPILDELGRHAATSRPPQACKA